MTGSNIRTIDAAGKIVIPADIRKELGLCTGAVVELSVTKAGNVLIEPRKIRCVCCGDSNEEELRQVSGVYMCPACIKKFNEVPDTEEGGEADESA